MALAVSIEELREIFLENIKLLVERMNSMEKEMNGRFLLVSIINFKF